MEIVEKSAPAYWAKAPKAARSRLARPAGGSTRIPALGQKAAVHTKTRAVPHSKTEGRRAGGARPQPSRPREAAGPLGRCGGLRAAPPECQTADAALEASARKQEHFSRFSAETGPGRCFSRQICVKIDFSAVFSQKPIDSRGSVRYSIACVLHLRAAGYRAL